MTGTILPPQETAMLRSVASSAAVLFTLMRIEMIEPGRAVSVLEIAGILAIDTRTVSRHMMKLSTANLVTSQSDRWMLTPFGRGTLFGEIRRDPHFSIEETTPLLSEPSEPAQIVHQIDREIEVNLINNNLSSISQECTNCANVTQILQAAAALFEMDMVFHECMKTRETDFVLGWIAKAYNDYSQPGSKLRSPTAMIYRSLLELRSLPVMYVKNPTKGLPASFLREIGMEEEADALELVVEDAPRPVSIKDWYNQPAEEEDEQYPDEDQQDAYGRNMRYMMILQKIHDGYDRIKAVLSGNETVNICSEKMVVYLNVKKNPIREMDDKLVWSDRSYSTEHEYLNGFRSILQERMSMFYRAQSGNAESYVDFELEPAR